jgi:hypothetical protein
MDVATVTQLISSVGFPIVCCIYLFKQNQAREEQTKEEIDKLSDAINNNTLVITQLMTKLDKDKEE